MPPLAHALSAMKESHKICFAVRFVFFGGFVEFAYENLPNKWTGTGSILAFRPGERHTALGYIHNSWCSGYGRECALIRSTV